MSQQYEVAVKIFSDIYGYPKWETKTKEGQNIQEIIKLWDAELCHYSVEQVRDACYRIVKYRKAQTFPTLSHILAELVEEKKTDEYTIEVGNVKAAQKMYAYLITHGNGNKIASQRTIWKIYQVEVDGYNHETDNLL